MGKATHTITTADIPVPGKTPEVTPEIPVKPSHQPEIEPDVVPSPAAPQSPGEPNSPGQEPGSPGREPEIPQIPPKKDNNRHQAPSINPDFDPDLPEKPGPPLVDPESPKG